MEAVLCNIHINTSVTLRLALTGDHFATTKPKFTGDRIATKATRKQVTENKRTGTLVGDQSDWQPLGDLSGTGLRLSGVRM